MNYPLYCHIPSMHLCAAMLQEINSLKPHQDFRLWMTAEVHPNFPTILLQSSLKITYEVWSLIDQLMAIIPLFRK